MDFEKGNLSRRGFLARSMAAITATGVPAWFAQGLIAEAEEAQSQIKKLGPNDKIVMGAIGTGSRGTAIMGHAMSKPNVEMVAVCDVDTRRVAAAAKRVGNDCRQYSDFRELCARKDIDAVTIGTPDHWHTLPIIEAMKAGKDVYCEKPLTLTIDEGKAIVEASKKTGRLLQTGSQQRSEYRGKFRLAVELVRYGRIGKLSMIETRIGTNPKAGPFKVQPVPKELDWDLWLGPTPKVEYVPERCHYTFRWWYDYSGGKMTDWGAHHNDIAQWALDMDKSGPVSVEPVNSTEPIGKPNCYNTHPTFEVHFTYANGVKVKCTSGGENGVKLIGEDGKWIFVSRGKINASDPKLLKEPLPDDAARVYQSTNHMGNFIDCVRNRKQPICNANVGHRSVTVCHLGSIALRLGRKVRWDPKKEVFVEDKEANSMRFRPYRSPWKLELPSS